MASVSVGVAASLLPKSLSYAVSRLNQYSRRRVRLVEQSASTATPNSTVKVILPQEVVDLSSVVIYFKLTTTTTAGKASVVDVENLLQSYYLTSGGVQITQQFDYPEIWSVFRDYQMGDKQSIRKVLSSKATGAPTDNLTDEPCALYSLLGFFNSAQPRCVDFGLMGKTELNLRLSSVDALVQSADCTGASYAISDLFIECDVLALPDVYYQSMNSYLSSGGIVEVPFQSITTFTASAGSINGLTQQFNIASQSVDAIIPTVYTASTRLTSTWDSTIQGNARYVRGAAALNDINIRVNNVPVLSYGPATPDRSFVSCVDGFIGLDETMTQSHPNLDSLADFKQSFYAHMHRFSHKDAAFGALISGMNTLANPANIMINYTGSGTTSCLPMTHVLCTSSILIGAGKAVEPRQ